MGHIMSWMDSAIKEVIHRLKWRFICWAYLPSWTCGNRFQRMWYRIHGSWLEKMVDDIEKLTHKGGNK